MKQFLTILIIIGVAVALYQIHYQQVEDAAIRARTEMLASMSKPTPAPAPRAAPTPEPPPVHAVAIARGLEELYGGLFAELNSNQPVDLTPPLEMTREHILDSKVRADAAMQPIYDLASKVVLAMVDVSEERTKALQSLVEAATRPPAALDGKNASSTSNAFFTQSAQKRWIDERHRRKPNVDALMTALRNAERNWNANLPPNAPLDSYEAPPYQTLFITAQGTTSTNSLERSTYNRTYPWRRAYYSQYGYRTRYY